MSDEQLKPCPFCGGKAVCVDRTIPDKTKPRFSILCESCRAATCWIDTEENAIAAWNRRAEPERHGYGTPDMAGMGVVNGG